MKKFWVTLLTVLMLITSIAGIVACDNGGNALANYVLAENGSLVEDDFVLPAKISDKEVQWKSDNNALTVEKRAEDWLAKLNLGDEAQNVGLTVTCGKEEKHFSVTVAALDVHYFVKKFNFAQENSSVVKDFDLVTSTKVGEKTATISWKVEKTEYENYIRVSADGKTCSVTPSPLNPSVKLVATFSYNGKTTEVPYRLTVSFEREHLEEVDYWYYNTGVSITMSGYVLAIGTAYAEKYENVTLYMIDDDGCAGYYLYRVKADKETGAKLKPGVHVTVTGTTNTNYNGLIETNAGGTLVIDEDKPALTEAQLREKTYAIDEDILAGSPTALYHTSSLVSLDKWKVIEKAKVEDKKTEPDKSAAGTVFTLGKVTGQDSKGNDIVTKVAINTSKYLEGAYKVGDDTFKAIWNLWDTLNVGDVVSVTGILSNYKGYQIVPLKASDVVKETAAESTVPEACTKAEKAIDTVKKAFKTAGVVCAGQAGYTIVSDKEIDCPEYEGVEIKYELIRESNSVAIAGGKIKVTAGVDDIASIKATYTVKNGTEVAYQTVTYHTIRSMKMNDAEVVDRVQFEFDLGKTQTGGSFELPTTVSQYPGATISWALEKEVEGISITENKGVTKFTVVTAETDREVTLIATFGYGTAKPLTKTFKLTVKGLKLDHAGTEADPHTAADAKKVFDILSKGETFQADGADKQIFVKGYVIEVGALNGTYGLKDIYIADKADAAKKDAIYVYQVNWGEAMEKADANPLKKGDLIVVRGFFADYNGTKQVAQGKVDGKTVRAMIVKWEKADPSATPETPAEPTVPAGYVELSFADKANRTSQDANSQVWAQNGVKLTNEKASSTSDVADYAKPARCYKGSSVKVELAGMTEIIFNCSGDEKYATALVASIGTQEGVTVKQEGTKVTVTFAAARNEFTIAELTAQVRIDSIYVKA